MSNFHVIIATERRKAPRELAISINNDLVTPTGKTDANGFPTFDVTPRLAQLHAMGTKVTDVNDPQIVYAAEWDGVSPYVVVTKGAIADLKMAYAGWPMIDKAIWDAINLARGL